MDFEESIYNLIPQEAYVPPKAARHKSVHDPKCAPTYSTFGLNTTSKPKISNISGNVAAPSGSHLSTANGATFGLPKGVAKPDSTKFRLKNTGTIKIPDGKYTEFLYACYCTFLKLSVTSNLLFLQYSR